MKRGITVSVYVSFIETDHGSTDAALDVVRAAMARHGEACRKELAEALEAIGARDINIRMVAY